MTIDPIMLELLYHKFKAATEEMGIALGRTARSSYVRETQDFGTALVDRSGRFFAYPGETGISLGIDQDCTALIEGVPDVGPGDVLATNHPYLAPGVGGHLPDINLLQPYFHDGELVCYGWSFAHCVDVGGGVPSSISPSFDSIFQEGLQIAPMKIVDRGVMSPVFAAMLRANSRVPDVAMGDLQAQLSALAVGERRVAELITQHGRSVFLAAQQGLVEYGRVRALAVQRRIPDGVYEFHDYLDDDYRTRIPVRIRCRMEVSDGQIHLDLTGTDPQVAAAYNVPTGGKRHFYLTAKLLHFLFTHDAEMPMNHGIFGNITVHVPAGTVMNPLSPGAVGVRHAGAIRFSDTLLGCLIRADPTLAMAASGGTVIPAVVAQTDAATGLSRVSVIQALAGGAGATGRNDGANGRDRSLANIHNTPTERGEMDLDVRIECYSLWCDSGGPGRYRGGTGIVYAIRFLQDGMELMGRGLERFVFQPWGIGGGRPGCAARVVLNMGRPGERELGKIDRVRLDAGDLVTIMTPGGGGYGDPFERPADAVLRDVRFGTVSLAGAARDYGVAIDAATLAIDAEATRRLRGRPREAATDKGLGAVRAAWDDVFEDAAMTRLAVLLLALPAATRSETRRQLYEDIIPGISTEGARLLLEEGFDGGAARVRLAAVISKLEIAASPAVWTS